MLICSVFGSLNKIKTLLFSDAIRPSFEDKKYCCFFVLKLRGCLLDCICFSIPESHLCTLWRPKPVLNSACRQPQNCWQEGPLHFNVPFENRGKKKNPHLFLPHVLISLRRNCLEMVCQQKYRAIKSKKHLLQKGEAKVCKNEYKSALKQGFITPSWVQFVLLDRNEVSYFQRSGCFCLLLEMLGWTAVQSCKNQFILMCFMGLIVNRKGLRVVWVCVAALLR